MSRATKLREAAVQRALEGPGRTTPAERRAAFDNAGAGPLIDKVARNAWKVTDEDVRGEHGSEDQVFEKVVCAAFGQATRQLAAALRALDEATT